MVLHVNHKSIPTSQTWSYTKTHIGSYVMTGLFGRRNTIDAFTI
ncbi:hypothetical protein F383_05697 [Gossypium arboreum]|uniref:Uncharacterized protein n=1 Tax=Gossypium arboreum TaxID=29729 RepID=A0A0B0PM43_GOSAR|nr:hypothetical protein F383_05697 [Gossypium arboreum]